jgi:GAF domain-containing protein
MARQATARDPDPAYEQERPLAESLARAAGAIVEALPAEFVFLCLPDPGSGTASLHPLYEGLDVFPPTPPSTIRIAGSLIGEILGDGEARILDRPFPESCFALGLCVRPDVQSILIVPLEAPSGVLGTLLVAGRRQRAYERRHAEAIRPVARALARAIEAELASLA